MLLRLLSFIVALVSTEVAYKMLSGEAPTIESCFMSVIIGVILSIYLIWLIDHMKLQRIHIFLFTWLNLFVISISAT